MGYNETTMKGFIMLKFAMQLTEDLKAFALAFAGAEEMPTILNDVAYVIITWNTPTEFNMKFVTEEEIFEAAKNDPHLEIISV
jgi:hypothetical protein